MRPLLLVCLLVLTGTPALADGKGWYVRLSTGLLLGPAPDAATAAGYCQTTRDPDCKILPPERDSRRRRAAMGEGAGAEAEGNPLRTPRGLAPTQAAEAHAGDPAPKPQRKPVTMPVTMIVPPLETFGPPLPALDGETDDDPRRLGPPLPGVYHPQKIIGLGEAAATAGRERYAALTIDDGPDPVTTPQLLDILARAGVKATFFLVGNQIRRHPDLVGAIVAGGHEIGNHSKTHPIMTTLGVAAIRDELGATNALIEAAGAPRPVWFRPPYGSFDGTVAEEAQRLGMATILWSIDPRDWRRPEASVLRQRIADQHHPGAVILLHDHKPGTVTAMPGIIKDLQAGGYQLVTISEWRRLGEPPRIAGLR